jgi:hypothetical protein
MDFRWQMLASAGPGDTEFPRKPAFKKGYRLESLTESTRGHDSALEDARSLYPCFHVVKPTLGKQLMTIGGTLLAVGAILCCWRPLRQAIGGGLPDDIVIERSGFSFYFPVVTCLVLSLVLSWVLRWLNR